MGRSDGTAGTNSVPALHDYWRSGQPGAGPPPKLTGEQMRQVYRWVVGGDPRQYSFDVALWTRDLVRQLIRDRSGVVLSAVSVGRLLREAGLRSDYHAGTTWGARGRTPVVKTTGARHSVTMVCAVTAKGQLRFATYTGSFTADTFIDFCKRLLRDTDRPVFLIVDGHPTHKAKKVKTFAASTNGQLGIYTLPCCSPELNPDEWVWTSVKADRVGRASVTDRDDLKAEAVAALRRLPRMPHIVRGFFADPNLANITA